MGADRICLPLDVGEGCLRRTRWLGIPLYVYDEIDSTNTQIKRLAQEGTPHGTVALSEAQTVGRGRRGRQWSSPMGSGIWFSLLLRPDFPPDGASMLTLVAAMAVAKAIRRITDLQPMIKWPNDVLLNGKKVCGILTELSMRDCPSNVPVNGEKDCSIRTETSVKNPQIAYIIVGIGINVRRQQFPPEITASATSLEQEGADHVNRAALLEAVLEEFEGYYETYSRTLNVIFFQEEYESLLANRDREVQVLDPAGAYRGIARGINEKGELLVECGHGLVRVNSGEVSVRGICGYV